MEDVVCEKTKKRRGDKLSPRFNSATLTPVSIPLAPYIYLFISSTLNQLWAPQHHLRPAQRMVNLMSLPAELRIMIFKFLLRDEVQPTECRRPYKIPICKISENIRKEAYEAYISSNDILFCSARSACSWLGQISSYLGTQDEKSLKLTFAQTADSIRLHTSQADQRRLFRLLGQRTKLDLTIMGCYYPVEGQSFGTPDLMHGFASVTSAPAPAGDSRCERHRCVHQFCHHPWCLEIFREVVIEEERRATFLRGLLDHFASACPARCEHLTDTGTWNSSPTIHIDQRPWIGWRGDQNCFICFMGQP